MLRLMTIFVFGLIIVIVVSVDKDHHVGFLLNTAGLTQVGQLRLTRFASRAFAL